MGFLSSSCLLVDQLKTNKHKAREKVEHDFSSTLLATERMEIPRLLPHFVRSHTYLYTRIMFDVFHCCGRHLWDQHSLMILCSFLRKAQPPCLMTSAGMLSCWMFVVVETENGLYHFVKGWWVTKFFGMIGSFGRSSRKPGSVVWTLFCRYCRYSAHRTMINSLFLIRTPSVFLSGCKEMLWPPFLGPSSAGEQCGL